MTPARRAVASIGKSLLNNFGPNPLNRTDKVVTNTKGNVRDIPPVRLPRRQKRPTIIPKARKTEAEMKSAIVTEYDSALIVNMNAQEATTIAIIPIAKDKIGCSIFLVI